MQLSGPEYRVLLTVDVEDYSTRTDAEQREIQSALRRILDDAADAAGLDRNAWDVQHAGDGLYALLPVGTNVAYVMDPFVREIDAGLGSHNRRREGAAWSRIRLRMAVHAGPVHVDGAIGWPGHHAVKPARLRDSEPIRTAMAALGEADLAVIVSSEIYLDYITQGPGEPRPSVFRSVRVIAKKQDYVAYLYVPRFDLHELVALARFDPVSATGGVQPAPASSAARSEAIRRIPPILEGGQVNVAYGNGDAFGGDKVGGDKHIHHGGRDDVR